MINNVFKEKISDFDKIFNDILKIVFLNLLLKLF